MLVVNAGSSSLKLRLLADDDTTLLQRELPAPEGRIDKSALNAAIDGGFGDAEAVGHRIVHGGERFRQAIRLDDGMTDALRDLSELAPLHQPKSLAALDAVSRRLPAVPAVACFDTAFHATLPAAAATYAIPRQWRERWGVRRYGFHGLSHSYASRRAAAILNQPIADLRVVTCHLGAGASLAAVDGGRSVDTTMGFTPVEGLVMATRSGSVDPGMLMWLLEKERLSTEEMSHALEHDAGLAALAGSADMREILRRAATGDADAELAVAVYLQRLRAGIAAMAAALGGLDVLVFTGGVGERAPMIRSEATDPLSFLGVTVDATANRIAAGDTVISPPDAPVTTIVITAREDLEIVREVRAVMTA